MIQRGDSIENAVLMEAATDAKSSTVQSGADRLSCCCDIDAMQAIRTRLKATAPLIHCITNPISINQCANLILAVDARPIMAEHPEEVREITRIAGGLLLNLGNITDVRLTSIVRAAEEAELRGIPYILDAVGVSCSELRRTFLFDFLRHHRPTVIKGNYSEIHALYNGTYRSSGVDADDSLDTESCGKIAMRLAEQFRCVVLASGAVDIVTDGKRRIHIKNGTPMLAKVTGTGCMLGALCASYLAGSHDPLTAAVMACAVLGICGELAETDRGTGTFMVNLMDRLSTLTDAELAERLKLDIIA